MGNEEDQMRLKSSKSDQESEVATVNNWEVNMNEEVSRG